MLHCTDTKTSIRKMLQLHLQGFWIHASNKQKSIFDDCKQKLCELHHQRHLWKTGNNIVTQVNPASPPDCV